MTNRERLISESIDDLLTELHYAVRNGPCCIIYALTDSKRRCCYKNEVTEPNCEKCIAEWLGMDEGEDIYYKGDIEDMYYKEEV